jgi:hypothetical protein
MKRTLGLVIGGFLVSILLAPVSHGANFLTSTFTEIQSYPSYVQDAQKVRRFEIGLSADDPDKVIFNAIFINGITGTTMAKTANGAPLMRIKIFYSPSLSSSTYAQLTLDAPVVPYQGETKLDAITNNSCGAKTWMPNGTNSITFELSRTCVDLPDKFYAALFVDVNINQDNQDYFSIPVADANALSLDFSKYPKPKKVEPIKPVPKQDQIISGYIPQSSYTLDVTSVNFSTATNSGLPIQITGKTPTVCSVTSPTTISLIGVGACVVSLNSNGNDLWNTSPEVNFSFNVLPKKVIPKVDQNLYFNQPGTLYENSPEVRLDIYSDSKLDVQVTSTTPNVCMFPYSAPNNTVVKIYAPGTCAFTVKQAGNDRFNARDGSTSIQIYPIPKPVPTKAGAKPVPAPTQAKQTPKAPTEITILNGKSSTTGGSKSGTSASGGGNVATKGFTTIICVKNGKQTPVTAKNPKCPLGSKPK